MIFAGIDGGLPCFVGKYVNFSNNILKKNFISIGAENPRSVNASCSLEQYQVFSQSRTDINGNWGWHWHYYDGSNGENSNYISLGQTYKKSYYNNGNLGKGKNEAFTAIISPTYFQFGITPGYNLLGPGLTFDALNYYGLFEFKATYESINPEDDHHFLTQIRGSDNMVRIINFYNNNLYAGINLKANEGSVYAYIKSGSTNNFCQMRGYMGRLETGINTDGPYISRRGSAYGLMGQLEDGMFGLLFKSFDNQMEWAINPYLDYVEFFLKNNYTPNRVGLKCSKTEASIYATSHNYDSNFLWDGQGSGILHIYGGQYSMQNMYFYASQSSFWMQNYSSGCNLKWNSGSGIFQAWDSAQRYIDLWLYRLESGMTATFHYVYTCDENTGEITPYKSASGRNVMIFSTGPIIVKGCQSQKSSPLCAIQYG
jgi:hypothetical protein